MKLAQRGAGWAVSTSRTAALVAAIFDRNYLLMAR